MTRHHPLTRLALVCLTGLLVFDVLSAALGAGAAARQHSVRFPIKVRPKGGGAATVECVVNFGPRIAISAVAFSPDGKALAVGGYQEVLLWDLAAGKLAKRIGLGDSAGFVHSLTFNNDGKLLAVGAGTAHSRGLVRVLDVGKGQPAFSFDQPKDVIYSLAFTPDGNLLAGGGPDQLVYVWSVKEKKLAQRIKSHSDWVLGVSFSHDGKLLASAGADNSAQLWEVGSWKPVRTLRQNDAIHGSAFSPDGQMLALAIGGPKDRAIRIMRRSDGRQIRAMGLGQTRPLEIDWTKKSNRIYVPCTDNTVKVYNGANGRHIADLRGHEDWVYSVAVSADESKVATGSGDGTIKIWNGADNRLLATLIQLSPRSDRWVIVTAPGYLASSSPEDFQWSGTNEKTPPEKLVSVLRNSGLVVKALAGEKLGTPALP